MASPSPNPGVGATESTGINLVTPSGPVASRTRKKRRVGQPAAATAGNPAPPTPKNNEKTRAPTAPTTPLKTRPSRDRARDRAIQIARSRFFDGPRTNPGGPTAGVKIEDAEGCGDAGGGQPGPAERASDQCDRQPALEPAVELGSAAQWQRVIGGGSDGGPWCELGLPAAELRLEHTLMTGMTFRWAKVDRLARFGGLWNLPPGLTAAAAAGATAVDIGPAPTPDPEQEGPAGDTETDDGAVVKAAVDDPVVKAAVHPGPVAYSGVVAGVAVILLELPSTTVFRTLRPGRRAQGAPPLAAVDYAAVRDAVLGFLSSHVRRTQLDRRWRSADRAFADRVDIFGGVRVPKVPLLEAIVSFLGSANNSIKRNTKMLAALALVWSDENGTVHREPGLLPAQLGACPDALFTAGVRQLRHCCLGQILTHVNPGCPAPPHIRPTPAHTRPAPARHRHRSARVACPGAVLRLGAHAYRIADWCLRSDVVANAHVFRTSPPTSSGLHR